MMAHKLHQFSKLLLASMLVLFTASVRGGGVVTHIVGDSIWSIPPTPDFYKDWSKAQSFHYLDILYFVFETEMYNLVEVDNVHDYNSCDKKNMQFYDKVSEGPATHTLQGQDVYIYFVCPMFNYCSLGMKLAVWVNKTERP